MIYSTYRPPLYADTRRFVLHEGAVAPRYLVPLVGLEEQREALFAGNCAGALDETGSHRNDEYRLSDLVDRVFFKGEHRYRHLPSPRSHSSVAVTSQFVDCRLDREPLHGVT